MIYMQARESIAHDVAPLGDRRISARVIRVK
jgi:hypothetical protein